jgi:hypothetical protein
MPVPYQFVECPNFPDVEVGASIAIRVQAALPWGDPSATTSLTYVGPAEHVIFERYDALHQVEKDVDAFVDQQQIKTILMNRRFPAFYNRRDGYWLVCASRQHSLNLFERLRREYHDLEINHVEVNLAELSTIGSTTGAYFGNLKIDKVRTAAVFGSTTIVESEEWEHYSDLGDLSVIYMRVMATDGESRALMLMRDRGVLLMKDFGERLNLSFMKNVQQAIESALSEPRPPSNNLSSG